MQERLLNHPKIEVIWDHVVEEILGEPGDFGGVTGARLLGVKTGEPREITVDGVFVAIGHKPATELFTDQLETKAGGYLVTAADSTGHGYPRRLCSWRCDG